MGSDHVVELEQAGDLTLKKNPDNSRNVPPAN